MARDLYRLACSLATADDVVVQFVRSQGAGGQNVNKGAARTRRPGTQTSLLPLATCSVAPLLLPQ